MILNDQLPTALPPPRLPCGCRPGQAAGPQTRCREAQQLREARDQARGRAEALPLGDRERAPHWAAAHRATVKLVAHLAGRDDG